MPHKAANISARSSLRAELAGNRNVNLHVSTSSMRPTLLPGDILTVSPITLADLKQGDILVLEINNEWVAHRLLAVRQDDEAPFAITRGDNAPLPDAPISLSNIIGRVSSAARRGLKLALTPLIHKNVDNALLYASFPADNNTPNTDDIFLGFDHNVFISASSKEELSPLIYYYNKSIFSDTLNGCDIKNKYLTTLARNTLFLELLDNISELLNGFEFILLKGAYLSTRIYDSPALRAFADIDLLARYNDVSDIQKRLNKLGYTSSKDQLLGANKNQEEQSGYLNSILLRNPDKPNYPSLHLHWHLLNSILPKYAHAHMDINIIWSAASLIKNRQSELSPEHLLIHLADHAMRHSFDRLILLRDIAEVIIKLESRIDWNVLISECRRFNLGRSVFYSLYFTREKTGTFVPDYVLESLRPAKSGLLEKIFAKSMSAGKRSPELCNLLYIADNPDIRSNLKYVGRVFFPPKSALARAYGKQPDDINAGTYAKRLLRGLKYLGTAINNFIN